MKETIDQYIWGFQQHFRLGVEYEIQHVLSEIGLQTNNKVKVCLIGFAAETDLKHRICIEPEEGPLSVDDFRSVDNRTAEILQADPESNIFHTHPRIAAQRRRRLLIRSRARAVAEAIENTRKFEMLDFSVSESAPIGGYEVHTCVGIPKDALQAVPTYNNPKKNEYWGRHIAESFVQEVLQTCLNRADQALYLPDPGEGLIILGDRTDIIRCSADQFARGLGFALTSEPRELYRLANDFSSLTYERAGAKGQLVVTEPENLANKLKVTFQVPMPLNQSRSVRKVLELTNEENALLTDGGSVYGLGNCNSAPDVARIVVEGHARWSLSVDETVLMKVTNEHASLPRQILDKEFFRDIAERTVGTLDIERIWEIFQCALEFDHGTTIVISADPAKEVERLSGEAIPIKSEYLQKEDVARLGRVDGAIVLGPDGRCHAFGVILDGLATSSGDRARGARFNSSVRYQKTTKAGTMIIVISDDGTVDLIPSLRPRIRRQDVEDAVQAFCDYSGEGNDREEWARRSKIVEDFSFYLNEEQCTRVNEAYEKEMDSRFEREGLALMRDPLQPSPEMNDSYFLL